MVKTGIDMYFIQNVLKTKEFYKLWSAYGA